MPRRFDSKQSAVARNGQARFGRGGPRRRRLRLELSGDKAVIGAYSDDAAPLEAILADIASDVGRVWTR